MGKYHRITHLSHPISNAYPEARPQYLLSGCRPRRPEYNILDFTEHRNLNYLHADDARPLLPHHQNQPGKKHKV